MSRYKSSQAGFTLIEIAIVLIIGGIFTIAALSLFRNYMLDSKRQTTQSRMHDIDAAITQYLNTNGVLPCPALQTLAPGQAGFGKSITDSIPQPNDCYNTAPASMQAIGMAPVPVLASNLTPGKIVIGAVPVLSLGLPGRDIADAWGNLFTYAVTDTLTVLSPKNGYDPTQGAIKVQDLTGNFTAPAGGVASASNPAAQYVIVSYGEDGAGAYTTEGVPNGTTCAAAPPLESINCSNSGTFRESRQLSTQTGTANMFGDYVIFHALTGSTGIIPIGTVAPFALAGCPVSAGWTPYGGPASLCTPNTPPTDTGLPPYICCQKTTNP